MRPLNSRHRDPALERALPGAALMLEACALVDASVGAAVRPLACRRYLVLDRPCAPGEMCTESRPADMLIPARKALHAALAMTFPWYDARWQALGLPEPPEAEPGSEAARPGFAPSPCLSSALRGTEARPAGKGDHHAHRRLRPPL